MSRKFLYSLATVLIVVGIIGSVLTFGTNKEMVTKKHTFPSTAIKQVDVSASNLKVEVLSTTEDDILVELSGTKTKNLDEKFEALVDAHTLKVTFNDRKWTFLDFDSFMNALELTIQLPEKQYEQLNVKSDNGRIAVRDIHADDVVLDTANGVVEGENLTTSTFDASANNGKIILKNIKGTIEGITNNGTITLTTPDIEQSIHFKTDNGKITIHSEREPENVTFITSVGNGSVDIFGKYDGSAVIGNGDNVVELETGNGKINVTD